MHGSNFVVKLSSWLAGNGLFPKRDRVEYTRIKHSSYFLISLYLYDIVYCFVHMIFVCEKTGSNWQLRRLHI